MQVKVYLSPTTGWLVELSPGGNPFPFPTKAQAITFAIAWGEQRQPCEVRLYGSLGDLDRILKLPNGGYRRGDVRDRRQAQIAISFPDRRRQERRVQT